MTLIEIKEMNKPFIDFIDETLNNRLNSFAPIPEWARIRLEAMKSVMENKQELNKGE
jgi:hypothetical protein